MRIDNFNGVINRYFYLSVSWGAHLLQFWSSPILGVRELGLCAVERREECLFIRTDVWVVLDIFFTCFSRKTRGGVCLSTLLCGYTCKHSPNVFSLCYSAFSSGNVGRVVGGNCVCFNDVRRVVNRDLIPEHV